MDPEQTLHILLINVQNTGLLICCDVLATYLELGGSVQHDVLGTALDVFHPTRQPTHLQQTHPQLHTNQLTYNKHLPQTKAQLTLRSHRVVVADLLPLVPLWGWRNLGIPEHKHIT